MDPITIGLIGFAFVGFSKMNPANVPRKNNPNKIPTPQDIGLPSATNLMDGMGDAAQSAEHHFTNFLLEARAAGQQAASDVTRSGEGTSVTGPSNPGDSAATMAGMLARNTELVLEGPVAFTKTGQQTATDVGNTTSDIVAKTEEVVDTVNQGAQHFDSFVSGLIK